MRRVVVESPLSGDFQRNVKYAKLCCLDCIRRGEAPYASHLLMTQFLDDARLEERLLGMEAGFAWGEVGEVRAFYLDLGVSRGMEEGQNKARVLNQEVEMRYLPADLLNLLDNGSFSKTEGF